MNDYTATITVWADAAAARDALTHLDALSAWWAPATGSGRPGGTLRFWFDQPAPCQMHVDEATTDRVRWTVTACDFLPDWVGTHPTFTLRPVVPGRLEIEFVHYGLTPDLDCIEMCTEGWNHFVPSLGRYLESGVGDPFGSAADLARRAARSTASD